MAVRRGRILLLSFELMTKKLKTQKQYHSVGRTLKTWAWPQRAGKGRNALQCPTHFISLAQHIYSFNDTEQEVKKSTCSYTCTHAHARSPHCPAWSEPPLLVAPEQCAADLVGSDDYMKTTENINVNVSKYLMLNDVNTWSGHFQKSWLWLAQTGCDLKAKTS